MEISVIFVWTPPKVITFYPAVSRAKRKFMQRQQNC